MAIPLWGKLVLLSLTKKAAVIVLAKVYGIPRLYRKTLRGTRLLVREPEARRVWTRRIEGAYRLPDRLLAKLRGLRGPAAAAEPTAAAPAWASPLAAAAAAPSRGAVGLAVAAAARQQLQRQPATRLRHLATSFRQRVRAASQRVRGSAAPPLASAAPPLSFSSLPFASFAAQPLLAGRGAAWRQGIAAAKQSVAAAKQGVLRSVAEAGEKGRSALERKAAELRRQRLRRAYWQRAVLGHAA